MWSLKLRGIIPSTASRCLLLSSSRNAYAAVNAIPKIPPPAEVQGYQNSRQSIVTLDRELRRFGRIRTDHYTNALNDAVEQKFLTAQHAVLLLRSLGSALSDEPPAVRVQLAKTLWQQLETLGVKPDVGLFNALLQTYIENDHFEQPSTILEKMKAANVTPNKVTYQRIIGLYCLKGDINAASTVLNHMKSEGHPVNETLFAHLIHGHIRAGDIAGAKSIFETMRFVGKAGIEPTAASFSMLMLGFAERGDIEAIANARKLATESNCLLLPRDFVPTIISLAKNGHSAKVPNVLELVTNHVGYNRDMMAAILQLCAMQKFTEAVDLFWTLRRPSPSAAATISEEGTASHESEQADALASQSSPMLFGRFLVRSLIKHRAPVDLVATTMQQMRERNVNSDTSLDAARIAAEFGRADQFHEWLRCVKKEELLKSGIRQHMFWPMFRALTRSSNTTVDSVLDVVNEMKSLGVNLEHSSFVTLSEFLFPAFSKAVGGDKKLATSVEGSDRGILAKLESAGYQPEHVAFSWLVYIVKKGLTTEAKAHLAKKPRLLISPAYLSEYLAGLLRSTEGSLPSVVEILSLLQKNPNIENPDNVEMLVGRTLIEAIYAKRTPEWPASVVDAFANAGLKPSAGSVRAARVELERRNTSKELISRLDTIAAVHPPQGTFRSSDKLRDRSRTSASAVADTEDSVASEDEGADELSKMSADQLESALAKAKEMQRPTLRVEKYLLMRYCQFGDIEKAEKLKAKLDARNFVYPPSMLRALLTLSAAHKQSLTESLDIKEKLEAAGGMASPGATIDIAALQVRSGKMTPDEILNFLRSYSEHQASILNKRQMGQSMLLYRPASRLVQAFVDAGQHKAAAKAMLTLIECGFISPRCHVLGEICVNAFIKAKDWDGLVDIVETMARKHKTVIVANDVLSALIGAGDNQKAKLQRCIDSMSSCQGEMATLNALMVSLIECDKLNDARKVLETPGLRALPRYLSWACENLVSKGKYDAIYSLVSLVRGLYNADVEDMYFRLIKAYGRPQKGDKPASSSEEPGWKKAMKVYERFEEESIQPRPRTLRYLADILKDNNQSVPFQVPQVSIRQESTSPTRAATSAQSKSKPVPIPEGDTSLPILKDVRRAIELLVRGKPEEAISIRSQLDHSPADDALPNDDSPKSMSTTFMRLLVQQLVDKHSHDLLVKLSSALAADGATDDLVLLRDIAGSKTSQPLPDWCWEKLSVDFVSAHERAGKLNKYVRMLGDKGIMPAELRRYLSANALSILRKSSSPDVWNELEKIIRKSAGNLTTPAPAGAQGTTTTSTTPNLESMSLLNRFWTACVLGNDLERATRLEKDYPQLLERPPLAGILRQAKSLSLQNSIPVFDHLLSTFKGHPNHASFVLSYILPMLADAGDWAAVRQRVTAMTSAGIQAETLRPFAIAQLQAAAEKGGIALPDEIARLPKQAFPERKPTSRKPANDSSEPVKNEPRVDAVPSASDKESKRPQQRPRFQRQPQKTRDSDKKEEKVEKL